MAGRLKDDKMILSVARSAGDNTEKRSEKKGGMVLRTLVNHSVWHGLYMRCTCVTLTTVSLYMCHLDYS